MNKGMSIPRPIFLSIPPELRQQIYLSCFGELFTCNVRNRRAIASACCQTRSEPLRSWTAKGEAELLREITDIFLYQCTIATLNDAAKQSSSSLIHSDDIPLFSQNIDFSAPTFCNTSSTLDRGDQRLSYRQNSPSSSIKGSNDMSAITQQIFSSVPNLRHALFSLETGDQCSYPGQLGFKALFLRTVAACCPELSDLDVMSDLRHPSDLQGFQTVHPLEWSGMSLSTPQETLAVLNSPPYLQQ